MDFYLILVDNKKQSKHKSLEDSLKQFEILTNEFPQSSIQIMLEQFCEFGYSDTCAKIYLVYDYKNGIINKYI